jgi:hypothetical protein
MGRQHSKRRSMKIKQAQKRRFKLAKLRKKYIEAKNESEKDLVLTKVFKIVPWLTKKEFLAKIKNVEKEVKDNKKE